MTSVGPIGKYSPLFPLSSCTDNPEQQVWSVWGPRSAFPPLFTPYWTNLQDEATLFLNGTRRHLPRHPLHAHTPRPPAGLPLHARNPRPPAAGLVCVGPQVSIPPLFDPLLTQSAASGHPFRERHTLPPATSPA